MAPAMFKSMRVFFFCLFASLAGSLFGYDIGVISSCFIMPNFIATFGELQSNGQYVLSTDRQSLITSLLSAGTFCGAFLQAYTSDLKFGRRGSIFIWAFIFTIGCIIQVSSGGSHAYPQLQAGRTIAGLGVGALSALVPLYNGETAPKEIRGTMLALYQVMICVGLFMAYGIDYGTEFIDGPASWRVPVGFQLFFGAVICTGIWFLPESPRLLLSQGRTADARRNIAMMNSVSPDDELVTESVLDFEAMLELENEGGKASWIELFRSNHMMWKRTLNACMLQFVQQLNGQNFYYYYGATFFQQARLTSLSSTGIQWILGSVTLAAVFPALYLIEKLGRRKMLFIGGGIEIVCALVAGLAGHFMLAPEGTPEAQLTTKNIQGGQLLVAFAILQIVGFGMFWGPTPWVVGGETFPLRVRAKGIAAASMTNWLWNFLLGYFSSKIAAQIGPLILLIFAGVLAYGMIYIYFMLPETAGLSLEEVDELYTLKIKPWKSTNWDPPTRMRKGLGAKGIGYGGEEKAAEKREMTHHERAARAAGGGGGH